IPSVCQLTTAAAKASCIASSARSKECEMRMRPAIMRPDSLRKTASTVARWSCIHGWTLGKFADRPNLNASGPARAGSRNFSGPGQSFVQILTLQNVVSGQLLFGFCKWPVGDQRLAILHANGGSRGAGLERIGSTEDAAFASLIHDGLVSGGDRTHLLRSRGLIFVGVDQHHVTHGGLSVEFEDNWDRLSLRGSVRYAWPRARPLPATIDSRPTGQRAGGAQHVREA